MSDRQASHDCLVSDCEYDLNGLDKKLDEKQAQAFKCWEMSLMGPFHIQQPNNDKLKSCKKTLQ